MLLLEGEPLLSCSIEVHSFGPGVSSGGASRPSWVTVWPVCRCVAQPGPAVGARAAWNVGLCLCAGRPSRYICR